MKYSEKFDLILVELNKLDGLEEKLDVLEEKFDELEEKAKKLDSLERDVHGLKRQIMKSTAELKAMDELIFDELERVHDILDKHKNDRSVHTA